MGYQEFKPLYRKVNTKAAWNDEHIRSKHARHDRNSKDGYQKMKKNVSRGIDYTPLYMYLIKSVGQEWDTIYSYVIKRIPDANAVWHIVNKPGYTMTGNELGYRVSCCSEYSFYSELYIDETGILQKVKPELSVNDIDIDTSVAVTYSFNGKRIQK